ncbi:MAG: hypothetical protein WCG92_20900, partial [Hyphomicrobiales bacterium]
LNRLTFCRHRTNGWQVGQQSSFAPIPGTKPLEVFKMVKYLGDRLIENVAIVGGTHGNEVRSLRFVKQVSIYCVILK